jgi:hypothetical protein
MISSSRTAAQCETSSLATEGRRGDERIDGGLRACRGALPLVRHEMRYRCALALERHASVLPRDGEEESVEGRREDFDGLGYGPVEVRCHWCVIYMKDALRVRLGPERRARDTFVLLYYARHLSPLTAGRAATCRLHEHRYCMLCVRSFAVWLRRVLTEPCMSCALWAWRTSEKRRKRYGACCSASVNNKE